MMIANVMSRPRFKLLSVELKVAMPSGMLCIVIAIAVMMPERRMVAFLRSVSE